MMNDISLETWQIELLQKNYIYVALGLAAVLLMRMHQFYKKYNCKISIVIFAKSCIIYLILLCLWMAGITIGFYATIRISFLLCFVIFICLYIVTRVGERIIENFFRTK